jgi:hypothetical protein
VKEPSLGINEGVFESSAHLSGPMFWSAGRSFGWALATETFAENISAKAMVAWAMRAGDDMEGFSCNLLGVLPVTWLSELQ